MHNRLYTTPPGGSEVKCHWTKRRACGGWITSLQLRRWRGCIGKISLCKQRTWILGRGHQALETCFSPCNRPLCQSATWRTHAHQQPRVRNRHLIPAEDLMRRVKLHFAVPSLRLISVVKGISVRSRSAFPCSIPHVSVRSRPRRTSLCYRDRCL